MLAYNPLHRWFPILLVSTGAVVGGAMLTRAFTRRVLTVPSPMPPVKPPSGAPKTDLFPWLSPPGPKDGGPDMRDAILHSQTPVGSTYEDAIYILTTPYDGPLCITGGTCQFVVMYRSAGAHGWEIVENQAAAVARVGTLRAEHAAVA